MQKINSQSDVVEKFDDGEMAVKQKHKKKTFFKSSKLVSRQIKVAGSTVIIPILSFIFGIYYIIAYGVPLFFIGLWVVMHLVGMTGISVGYHRLAAHASFTPNRFVKKMLLIWGSLSAQGAVIYWVSNHRRHHHKCDREGDVHSPYFGEDGREYKNTAHGFWQAHTGWMFRSNPTNPILYCKDLLKDKDVLYVNRHYYRWILLGILLPGLVSLIFFPTLQGFLLGVLYGGLARIFSVQHATWLINSFTHMFGSKPYHTNDESTNFFWLALPTVGESWHNNHHSFPSSARLGLEWWQIDLGYYFLLFLKGIGVVDNLKVPDKETKLRKKLKTEQK